MMLSRLRSGIFLVVAFFCIHCVVFAQCPSFSNFSVTGNGQYMCEGESLTVTLSGQNIPSGSTVDFYIGNGNFNPYIGEGDFIGSVPVTGDDCNNQPEILYIMVNPDNNQVGSPNDKCDEFMVIWTGSGGFSTSDIVVSNLSNGSFQWNNFVAGNPGTFSCGIPLPPGPVPPNAILIIQGSTFNNLMVNSDILCASGLPVYIIAQNNVDCVGGWFDNDSPCASCPVQVDISGTPCDYSFNANYNPPANSTNGWGWSNTGSGVFGTVIPPVDVPAFVPAMNVIPNFIWTVPSTFCEEFGEGIWTATGIVDPPPSGSCADIFTPYFDVPVSCPSMELSGGGDVCAGNCPDAPNEIVFIVTGEDLPFEADLMVTASLFPPFSIDDLVITNGQQLFICLDGFLPSFDPSTNTLTIPTLAIGLTATIQVVSLTSASGCPVENSPNSISLHFIEAATSNAGPDQTICSYESVTLNGSIGGSASDAMWTTSGDGFFANDSDPTTTYTPGTADAANGSVMLTLTSTDVNGACIPATSSMNLTIEPSLIIDVGPPLTICNTDVATINAMITGPNVPGVWETDGDGTFIDPENPSTIYEPGSDDLSNGSVTLIYAPSDPDVCVESNEPLEITIVDAPVVNVPQNIEVCSEDSITIHINVNGNFTNISWSTSGDGIIMIINDTEINYTPGPEDINNQFAIVSVTVVSGFPECGQTTYNLPIDIIFCNCLPFVTNPPAGPLCSDNDTLDLSSLIVNAGSGNWSVTNVPAGSNPATITGNNFITNNSDGGVYTVTYTLNFPEDGCPATQSEFVSVSQEVISEAGAGIANCGPSIVFVNGLLNPFSNSTILWETLGDGSFVDPSSLNTSYTPGILDSNSTEITLVLHLFDPVCGDKSDTTKIYFPVPPFTTFIDDTIGVCNEVLKGSVVDFNGLITAGDITGTWTNTSGVPVDFSNPGNVNFDGIPSGYYSFNYLTNSAQFPCQNVNYTIVIEVEDCVCPLLQIQTLPGGICNTQNQLNLAAFVMAGEPGTWSVINSPPGSNPATLIGQDLQTLNVDPGLYRLRFTFDSAPILSCPDSAEIDIQIQGAPLINIISDTTSCGLLDIQLNAGVGGSATGLLWTTSGLGAFNFPNLLNPLYSPSIEDLNSATVTLYATTTDPLGFCNDGIDSVVFLLVHPPMTSWSSLATNVCNNPDSGSIVSLSSFIIGGDGTGIWSDLDGSLVDLSDPSSVDFDGVIQGTYTFSYLTQTAVAPCTDSTYVFSVIVEDCACPAFLFSTIDDTLCIPSDIDLSALIIDAADGNWSVINGPAGGIWPVVSGTNVITANADDGNYELSYKLIDSIAGCPATQVIPFVLESTPSVNFADPDCDEVSMTYSLSFTSDAATINVDFGTLLPTSPGNYKLDNIPSGQDLLFSVSSLSGSCATEISFDAPDCSCTLFTEDISDTIFICPGDTFVLIPFLTGAQGLAFSTWISDVTLMRPTLPLYEANTWIWIVRDSAGCERRDTFDVALRELITVEAHSLPPTCKGLADGSIVIDDVDGGLGPYTAHLDNNPPMLVNALPDTITNVTVGPHKLYVRNADGCETIVNITVNASSPGNLDLGSDVSIPFGDSVYIEPLLTGIHIAGFDWIPADINPGIESFWYKPSATQLLQLTIIDSMGCIYEDEILITVLVDQQIYIPTIFSPNHDQINDVFEVFTSTLSNPILSLEIFDRWGNQLYHQEGIGPFTWNGMSRNKEVSPGVYVIKVMWNDENGNPKVLIRDLTLIR